MGPELEPKSNSEAAMEALVAKDGSIQGDPEDKFMPCVSNYKDNTFDMEAPLFGQTTASNRKEHEELNRTGCTNSNGVQIIQSECRDSTENSSSFGNTFSGTENGSMLDGDEAESQWHENELDSVYDGYFGAFQTRKKKLSVHWRNFIRPLMWRCKWLELQIKELRSRSQKYDSELAKYDQAKKSEFEGFTSEGFNAILMPKFMKRKKRKRVEDTVDIGAYMSHHNLFSYESKKSVANSVCMEDDWGNLAGKTSNGNNEFETNDTWSSLEFRDGNSSLEDILWKIEVVHSQVGQLKTRIDKVVKENPGNFSFVNNVLVPCDALKGSAQYPASPTENGNRIVDSLCTASQHIECNMGDLFLPQSAVSSHAELRPLSGNTDQPWVGGSGLENAEDGYLIPDAAVKDEQHDFDEVKDQLIQKPHKSLEEQKTNFPVPGSETVLPTNSSVPNETQELAETVLPTTSSVPNATQQPDSTTRTDYRFNTRNRGIRKPGSYSYKRSRGS